MRNTSIYSRLIPYALRQWHVLSAVVLFTLAASAAAALQPWPVKILVDYGLKHDREPGIIRALLAAAGLPSTPTSLVILAAIASLALFAVNVAIDAALTWGWTLAGQRMVRDVSIDLFRSLLRMPILEHYRRPVGDSLSRLAGDAWCVYTMTDGLFTPGQHAVQFLTLGFIAWKLDHQLASMTLVLSPLLALSSFCFGRMMKKRARQSREIQSRFLSFVHQTLTAMPIVQAFSTEESNRQYLKNLASDAVAVSQRGAVVSSAYGLINGLILSLGMAVILYSGGVRVLAGVLPLGSLLVFLAYIKTMQTAAAGLIQTYATLKPVEASMERVAEILKMPGEKMAGEEDARAASARRQCTAGQAGLRFEQVTFGYLAEAPILKDVNLEVRPGEKVAIVGPSGAGKSTLALLILRFFDPSAGRLTLNGIDLREYSLESLRASVSIVLQDPCLFPVTIRENIAYGQPDASDEAIQAAAKAAHADLFIRQLPQGYETVVGERGSTLSGGEKQRLAIARAILKNAPLLILDEPTAALDTRTEAGVLDALERLTEGRTTLIIGHRLSTIRRADRVFQLRDGFLCEMERGREFGASVDYPLPEATP